MQQFMGAIAVSQSVGRVPEVPRDSATRSTGLLLVGRPTIVMMNFNVVVLLNSV